MALEPTILNQFKRVTQAHGLKVSSDGLNSLVACINQMDEAGVDRVLPHVLPLLEGLQTEIKESAEKTRITELVAQLRHIADSQGAQALAEKKRLLKNLFEDKTLQECLIGQFALMKAKRQQKTPPKSFAEKAVSTFFDKCNSDILDIGKRNSLDPLGMFFDHLFSAFGLMMDIMMEKMGFPVPEPKAPKNEDVVPENNPLHARNIPIR